jgi:hypothetical protein
MFLRLGGTMKRVVVLYIVFEVDRSPNSYLDDPHLLMDRCRCMTGFVVCDGLARQIFLSHLRRPRFDLLMWAGLRIKLLTCLALGRYKGVRFKM